MFSQNSSSSFGSPLHHLAAAAASATLSRSFSLHYLGAATTLSPPLLRFISLKLSLLSTSAAGNDTPTRCPEAEGTCPMSDFFLKECGLCPSEISTIFKRRPSFVGTRSTRTPEEAVQVMRDSGFTEHQVRRIITRNPSILSLKADRQLKPKIELMKRLGLAGQEVGNVICHAPILLTYSLEKTLCPNIQYLQNLFGLEGNLSKVLKWAPNIIKFSRMPETIEKKLKHLASFGLLEDEIMELVRRKPQILTVSMDKVQKIMDFFMHTARLPAKLLLTYPLVLIYSLERRIKPRHKVLESISVMQPSKRLPSLTSTVYLSERKFLEKYVKCSPQATKLLEIYGGKPVGLDIIQ